MYVHMHLLDTNIHTHTNGCERVAVRFVGIRSCSQRQMRNDFDLTHPHSIEANFTL